MKIAGISSNKSFSQAFRFRSFYVCVVALLLAIFTLFQSGGQAVIADASNETRAANVSVFDNPNNRRRCITVMSTECRHCLLMIGRLSRAMPDQRTSPSA